MQNRILIVIEDGALKGMSATTDTGSPTPLDMEGLAALIPEINAASLAEIERLKTEHAAELAAAQGQPAPATSILSELDAAFEAAVPAELQTTFEPAWVIVRNLIQAGKIARAAAYVRSLAVPDDLAPIRDQIADSIDGGS